MKKFFKTFLVTMAMILLFVTTVCTANAQEHTIKGIVIDTDGTPIIGVSVFVEGTTNGTSSDFNGLFAIANVSVGQTIQFSSIGYVTQSILVGSQTPSELKVILEEDALQLEASVVIGYGIQKKSDVTGSISSVKGESLHSRSVENAQQALVGKVAGVTVFSSSAAPSSTPSIRIRGLSSNSSGSSDPLYIVDGLKVDNIGYLDPNIIESMEVLKDGASAAIYGAEAGNGVLIITTKHGSKGKARIFYDMTYGFTSVANAADLMNAEQYVAYQRASGNGTLMDAWDGVTCNDWTKSLYGEGGTIQRHTFGMESGNDKGTIYASIGYLNNDGMFYGNKDYMKRLTATLNTSYNIKPWLELSSNNVFEYNRYSTVYSLSQSTSPYFIDPLTPLMYDKDNLPEYMNALIKSWGTDMFMKDEQGNYVAVPQFIAASSNPLTRYYSDNNETRNYNLRGTTSLNLKPIKELVITSRIGYRLSSSDSWVYGVPVYFAISPRMKLEYNASNSINAFYQWENFANYNKKIGKHIVSAMVGMSYQQNRTNFTRGTTNEFTNPASNFRYLSYSSSEALDALAGEVGLNRQIGYFGRIGYSFDDRYYLQANFRADAFDSSKLSKESRWGYFPSVSFGWTMSNESFMKDIDKNVLSFLKIRASYGTNGNVNVLGNYQYASSLGTSDVYYMNNSFITSISPSSVLANPSLQWETSKQIDAGIDARFLNDRLLLTIDYYNKNTDGQLISMTAPLSSGTSTVVRNVGLVNNHGFEFDIDWNDTVGDFYYNISANMATLSNMVVDMGGNNRIDGAESFVYFDEGQPVWSFYGWNYLGVAADGSAIYEDLDNNNTINDLDKKFLGSAIPKFTYGLNINLAWKGVELIVSGSGSYGGKLFLTTRNSPVANRLKEFWTESWDVKGAAAKYPHPDVNGDTHMYKSSMQLSDGSYFKFKQIQLGYTLPDKIIKRLFVSNLRFFVSLDNFITITNYKGMDPEAVSSDGSMGIDYGYYPNPKTLTLGLNLSF